MGDFLGAVFGIALTVAIFGGWLTHLYVCFTTAAWGFLIAGALFFPVGVVHGWGIWIGIW